MASPAAPSPSNSNHRSFSESFGDDAERYDRMRPRYPDVLAAAVLEGLPGKIVLDVGIGTGISALPFQNAGAQVTGVEVDERMAELARRRGFQVDVARFEEWNPQGRQFDAVIAGQTWHWIDPVVGAAKAADVLVPQGRLAVFWNVANPEPDLAAQFAEVYRTVDTGLPFNPWQVPPLAAYDAVMNRAIDGIVASDKFTAPRKLRFDWDASTTREAWLEQTRTSGGHNLIPPDKLAALLEGIGSVIDNQGGTVTMPYATVAVLTDRLAN